MNRFNPGKLQNSKWTAVSNTNKERHFIVTDVEYDDEDQVMSCCLEAVLTRKSYFIDWNELKQDSKWLQGWK